MSGLTGWVQQRIVIPVQEQLKSGLSPEKLAWSFAFGITCGLVCVELSVS
jgi:hypothetical protein